MWRTLAFIALVLVLGSIRPRPTACPYATEVTIRAAYCSAVHDCRTEFTLTPQEFEQQFGADPDACQTLDHAFVDAAVSNAMVTQDPELANCWYAILEVPCSDIVSDGLLDASRPCDPEVIAGRQTTDENYYDCDDTPGGCCD